MSLSGKTGANFAVGGSGSHSDFSHVVFVACLLVGIGLEMLGDKEEFGNPCEGISGRMEWGTS